MAGAGAPRYGGTARCAEAGADGVRGATWFRHRFVDPLAARLSAAPCSPPCASPPCSPACTCWFFGLWSLTFGLRVDADGPPNPLVTLGDVAILGEPGASSLSLC